MKLLPKWNLHSGRPTFYDTDAVTMLELAANLHGAMNELIAEYNQFSENVNDLIQEFIAGAVQDREAFETALRQEFQDFIDVIDLKYQAQEGRIDAKIRECEGAVDGFIADINNAIDALLNAEY